MQKSQVWRCILRAQLNLKFDEIKHEYSIEDGVKIPSVTQILQGISIINTTYFTPGSAANGKRRHKILEDFDKDKLDWSCILKDDMNYISAWQSFLEDAELEIMHIEKKVFHDSFFYAGTIDRIVKDKDSNIIVLDIKTGVKQKWHQLQLEAYLQAYNNLIEEGEKKAVKIWGVYLNKNGTYKKVSYEIDGLFNSAVNIWNWMKKNDYF